MTPLTPHRIKSITEIHRLLGFAKPHHPLIGLVDLAEARSYTGVHSVLFELYVVILKKGCDKLRYGQQAFDFDEGVLAFMAPGQILHGEENGLPEQVEGWMLFIHPDFLWNTSLATKLKQYEYFEYATHEALFLSDKEQTLIQGIVGTIRTEYEANLDSFSQNIIVSHLETLFNYAERFYQRQFLTRKKSSHQVLDRLESLLSAYFSSEDLLANGLPTVHDIADRLHVSPSYLRGLLKSLTGQSTQQLIHEKLIERAKAELTTTTLTVSEIAYKLGFEHLPSFSKLFKAKTKLSPVAFRQSFQS